MIKAEADKRNVDFRVVNVNADMDQYIRIDEVRIKQIFVNLLSNAVKFTPAGGTVEMRVQLLKREEMISHDKITITDTGIGMSKSFLQNGIFQPFKQDEHHVNPEATGTGLGLSIVKKLVELMGGSIQVESELGTGTRFTLHLDFERVNHEEILEHVKTRSEQKGSVVEKIKGKHILLAEDHPLNAEIARRLLEKAGCQVEWVKNGTACIDVYRKAKAYAFDVILMDIRMPGIDGLTAAKEIRRMSKEDAQIIPIIAVTANAYEEDVQKALDAGMNGHLAKPIDPQNMYETIARVIENV